MAKCALPRDGGLIIEGLPKDILHRNERIDTNVFSDEEEAVKCIAAKITNEINDFVNSQIASGDSEKTYVLGLSTGRTPIKLYKELVKRYEAGDVSFEKVSIYSLDELYPIKPTEKQSRNFLIHEEFINHIDINRDNVFIPDTTKSLDEISSYCESYAKGVVIDLMIVGIGEEGQVGFNEIGSHANSKTRLVKLSYNSRKTLAGMFFGYNSTPSMAITMGLSTILNSKKTILMAWGEHKASIIQKVIEGDITDQVPATLLQNHSNVEAFIDENAASLLTREQAPWLVGPCVWTPKFIRKAIVWLCGITDKPILKLTHDNYVENSLGELLEAVGTYDYVNIKVFNELQHTITGWPGGKPGSTETTRPVSSEPFPKRVTIFSPHPDDDVISMGGTFHRLIQQGHDVHVAYETSGNVAVHDDVVLQNIDTARELGYGDKYAEVEAIILNQKAGEPQPRALLNIKGSIRRAEARAGCRTLGLNDRTNAHFLNLPFYETGGIKKGEVSQADIDIIKALLQTNKPHQIYLAGDLTDPHGTHRVCTEAVLEAIEQLKGESWIEECHIWLYRGAWQEWDLGMVDMAVPISPDEMIKKRHAIYRHLSQKDIVPFPGSDTREFWQRAEERTQNTARLYDKLGMAEYQAMEVFVELPF